MPFTPVAAPQIDLLQNAIDGDVFIPSFSRRSFLQGATAGLLSLAPALTMVGNLLTVDAPVRNYSLATFAGLGLSVETTVAAGNFPVVASRDVQVNNVASTGHTYTYPTSRRVGQLLVMAVATAALTTITTPSGWTLVQSQAGTESRTSIFTRVLDGLEPSTELLAFGTASGAVVRTWMIDIGDGPVEAVAGINDSAAGTSLDLATISPTWAVAEATSTLYIAVLGLANDVTVSGFPAGYTVTGQDASVSGTANVDCALAYAERSALGSSENPGAFTYAASRSTGHVLAIKPKVTARLNWDGLTVRKNSGADVGTRRRVNLIEGAGVTLTVADVGTEIDVTIAAASGSAHTLRDDGVDMTQRAAANYVTSTTITAILTDDAANNETEITFQLGAHTGDVTSAANSLALTIANNAVTNAKAADMPALAVKANATNAIADPQDVASAADDTVFRRTATTLNWGQLTVGMAPNDLWTYAKIQNVSATARILGRITAGAGDIEELTGTQATTLLDNFTSALKGLAPASGGGTTNFLRADGTWAAPPGTITAGHVIRDDGVGMTQRAALNFVSGASAGNITFILADDAANGETEVTGTLAAQAANTLLANATAGSAAPTALAIAAESLVGRTSGNLQAITSATQTALIRAAGSLFWASAAADQVLRRSGSGDLGFGTLVTNNIGDDQVTFNKTQNITNNRILGRITAAAGNIEELTPTQVTSMLDVFTVADKGLVPASGGGTTNFLRADGAFAAPAGTVYSSGDSITVSGTTINYTGATGASAEVNLNAITGAQGVVNIASLPCGGRVTITAPTGAWSIDGFTAKPEGFWFVLTAASTNFPGKIINSTTASTGIRNPGFVDFTCNRQISGMFMYGAFGGGTQWLFIPGASNERLLFNGESWLPVDDHFDEEFYGSPSTFMGASSGAVGKWNWVFSGNGVYETLISAASHPGIVQLETPGALNDTLRAVLGGTVGVDGTDYASQVVLGDIAFFRVIVRIPTGSSLSNANYGIGFASLVTDAEIQGTTPNLGGNGLILHKNTGQTVWNFRRETAAAGVISLTARTAVLGDWIEVYGINNGGGEWSFIINGTLNASGLSGVSTSALVRPFFFVHQSAAGGVRQLNVDKFEFALRYQASRFTP